MRIFAGLGLRAEAEADALHRMLERHLPAAFAGFCLSQSLAEHALVAWLQMRAPVQLIPLAQLFGVRTITQSPRILQQFGTGSLAEAAALGASGLGGRLILPRQISPCRNITLALAQTGERP